MQIAELRERAKERLSRGTWRPETSWQDEQDLLRVELEVQKEDLEASRDRYAAWYDGGPVAMALLDPRSRILCANDTARALLGFDRAFDGKVALSRSSSRPLRTGCSSSSDRPAAAPRSTCACCPRAANRSKRCSSSRPRPTSPVHRASCSSTCAACRSYVVADRRVLVVDDEPLNG